jgi:shikimate kinase
MGCKLVLYARSKSSAANFERLGVVVHDWSQRTQSTSDVLVNCTPLGMWPRSGLLQDADQAGCQTLGGLDMFVRQAATQLALWTSASALLTSANMFLTANLAGDETAGSRFSVALIGARGSGKTTVGAILARLLGIRQVDTDELIEASIGKSITQIFASEGEAGFRQREREVIRAAVAQAPAVFSLGGGAVLLKENIDALLPIASIVWLTAPPHVLAQRIKSDPKSGQSRPPLTARDAETELAEVLQAREPLYRAAAELIVDTSKLTPQEIAQKIASWLNR